MHFFLFLCSYPPPSFIMHTSLPSLCPLLPREAERLRAEGREERRRKRRRRKDWREGAALDNAHSSNIFRPLRPWSEPLLVRIVWILSSTWHAADEEESERRGGGDLSAICPTPDLEECRLSPASSSPSSTGGRTSSLSISPAHPLSEIQPRTGWSPLIVTLIGFFWFVFNFHIFLHISWTDPRKTSGPFSKRSVMQVSIRKKWKSTFSLRFFSPPPSAWMFVSLTSDARSARGIWVNWELG